MTRGRWKEFSRERESRTKRGWEPGNRKCGTRKWEEEANRRGWDRKMCGKSRCFVSASVDLWDDFQISKLSQVIRRLNQIYGTLLSWNSEIIKGQSPSLVIKKKTTKPRCGFSTPITTSTSVIQVALKNTVRTWEGNKDHYLYPGCKRVGMATTKAHRAIHYRNHQQPVEICHWHLITLLETSHPVVHPLTHPED